MRPAARGGGVAPAGAGIRAVSLRRRAERADGEAGLADRDGEAAAAGPSRSLRILLSIHHDLDRDSGAPGVTLRLAEALRRRGHAVEILSFDSFGGPASLRGYLYPWRVAWHVLRTGRHEVLDLSSGDGWVLGLLAPLLGRRRPALLARSHGLEHGLHDLLLRESRQGLVRLSWKYPLYHGGWRLWECRRAFAAADAALLLNSHEVREAVTRLGVAEDRALRIRNGLAEAFLATARRRLAEPPPAGPPHGIAFVGTHLRRKGVEVLHRAMREVLQAEPAARLGCFGGQVPEDEVLSAYPPALRPQIRVVPRYRNEELPALLADYRILAFPSLFEGFPGTPLEAMACGLVPVVADAPGCPDYVRDGQNGMVVPASDPAALRDALLGLMRGKTWVSLRRAALATALDFSWDAVATEMEAIYRRCLGDGREA